MKSVLLLLLSLAIAGQAHAQRGPRGGTPAPEGAPPAEAPAAEPAEAPAGPVRGRRGPAPAAAPAGAKPEAAHARVFADDAYPSAARCATGSFCSENAFASSMPSANSSKRSTTPGRTRLARASGEVSIG